MEQNEKALGSWKEIASYLQRDAKTARTWEKEEGLPVHRHSHRARASVYAYPSEINTWRESRKRLPAPAPPRPLWKMPTFAFAIALSLVMVGNGLRPHRVEAGANGPVKRLLWSTSDFQFMSVSRNGRWLTLKDQASGDLALRDMTTGKVRRLFAKSGTYDESSEECEESVISEDGKQVVFTWTPNGDGHYQLKLMNTEPGNKPRLLVDSPEFEYFEPAAWSSDRKVVYVLLRRSDKTWAVAAVDVADGRVKILDSLGWRIRSSGPGGSAPALSPDGDYIAYSALAQNPTSADAPLTSKDRRVYVVATNGSGVAEIVKTAGINEGPQWNEDGSKIVYTSNSSGTFGLWQISVKDGRAAGSPTIALHDFGRQVVNGMGRGTLFYTSRPSDPESITIAGFNPGVASEVFPGTHPSWSPNGSQLAFMRRSPIGQVNGYRVIPRAAGEERTFPVKNAIPSIPLWLDDQRLAVMSQTDKTLEVNEMNSVTGETKTLLQYSATELTPPLALSRDKKTLFVGGKDSGDVRKLNRVVGIEIASGAQKILWALTPTFSLSIRVSPDGAWLGVGWNDGSKNRLTAISLGSEGQHEVGTSRIESGLLGWSADAKTVLFAQNEGRAVVSLMQVPTAGGKATFTGVTGSAPLQNLDLTSDGSRVAYEQSLRVVELWAVENLQSAGQSNAIKRE